MLKKSLLSLAITASVAGLSGCNISSVTDNDQATPDSQILNEAAETVISNAVSANFDVSTSVIPIGNDLYMGSASASDGTANTGLQGTAGATPVSDGIDRLDGGIGISAPIDIAMSGSVDTSTISGGQVLLIRLANSDLIDALDVTDILGQGANAIVPADQPSILNGDYRVEAISVDGGTNNTIRVVPLKPLVEKTKYLVVITDNVKAEGGAALGQSPNYEYVAGTDPLFNSGFEAVRSAIYAWTGLANAYLPAYAAAAALETVPSVNFVSAYTTVSTDTVLIGMANPEAVVNTWIEGAVLSNVKSEVRASTELNQSDYPAVWAAIEATYTGEAATVAAAKAGVANYIAGAKAQGASFSTAANRDSDFFTSASWVDNAVFAGPNGGKMIQGKITLPYYLGIPATVASADEAAAVTTAAEIAIRDTEMTGDTTLGTIIENVFSSPALIEAGALSADGIADTEAEIAALAAAGETLTIPPLDVDKQSYVNGRYPFVQKTGDVTVPVMVHMPAADAALDTEAALTCGSVAGTLCPVTIFIHGIGRNRADSLALANGGLAPVNHAVVAIDLPLHGLTPNSAAAAFSIDDAAMLQLGAASTPAIANAMAAGDATWNDLGERHFGYGALAAGTVTPLVYDDAATGTVEAPINEATIAETFFDVATYGGATEAYLQLVDNDSAANFINFTNFAVTRDLFRQSTMDMLNLAASLGTMDVDGDGSPDFDLTNVNVVGHSLGSIVATSFVHTLNTARATGLGAVLPEIQTTSLVTPGGQITRLLESSIGFAGSLTADPYQVSTEGVLEKNDNFGLLAGLASAGAVQGTADFESFMNVFQALLDGVDPISKVGDSALSIDLLDFATDQTVTSMPILAIEVVGDGGIEEAADADGDLVKINLPDQTIPNEANTAPLGIANSAPLAGTEPLMTLLDLADNTNNTNAANPGARQVVRLLKGEHGSLISANTSDLVSAAGIATATNTAASQAVQIEAITSFIFTGGAAVQVAAGDSSLISTVAP